MATSEATRPDTSAPDLHVVPVFVVDFDDERSRSRLREAGFISVIVHLLLFIALLLSPKWLPRLHPVQLSSAADLMHDRQLTFLDLPKDRQKVDQPPQTHTLSDKDRIAMSRRPTIDRKTLDELQDPRRPGRPGAPSLQAPPAPRVAQPQPAPPAPAPQPPANQLAHLDAPPIGRPDFSTRPLSPGSAIDEAARAAARARTSGGGGMRGGDLGDYGLGTPGTNISGNLDILSDTMGVDFGPYLARVVHTVRQNWYALIPEVAQPPLLKHGRVAIDFVILKDGTVAGMKLMGPSGDVSLDRAAWGGIKGSNPFPPLPSEFKGQYLALRFRFYYNPLHGEVR